MNASANVDATSQGKTDWQEFPSILRPCRGFALVHLMSLDPNTTLADFEGYRIPKSVFL